MLTILYMYAKYCICALKFEIILVVSQTFYFKIDLSNCYYCKLFTCTLLENFTDDAIA